MKALMPLDNSDLHACNSLLSKSFPRGIRLKAIKENRYADPT